MHSIYDFVDEGLGHSSYVNDLGDGTAAVVDPPRFPIAHEALVKRLSLRLTWTLDTHSHADYVTGSPALAERTGATFVAPAVSHLDSPQRPVGDREIVTLADGVELIAWETPGHTPDHHAYVFVEHGTPGALFSGGSLMVGLERATNPLFAIADEDEFVARLVAGFGTFPSYFALLPELNRRGPTRYDFIPHLTRLRPDDVALHLAEDGVVVDARPVKAFSIGHIPGSVSNTLRPVFASWLGWLIQPSRPLVFVLDPDQDRDDLVRQCLDVGHEHLGGELGGGIDAWANSGRPTHTIPLVEAAAMTGQVIDVRQANEYASGHVPGALSIELGAVAESELADGPFTVMCGHGERAMTAASILSAHGRPDVAVLDGGPDTWSTATGRTLETGR